MFLTFKLGFNVDIQAFFGYFFPKIGLFFPNLLVTLNKNHGVKQRNKLKAQNQEKGKK